MFLPHTVPRCRVKGQVQWPGNAWGMLSFGRVNPFRQPFIYPRPYPVPYQSILGSYINPDGNGQSDSRLGLYLPTEF